MAIRLGVSYYYVTPQDLKRIETFKDVAGDAEKTLVTQYVRGWMSRNRQYYWDLARIDAGARGLNLREWGEVVLGSSMAELPDYKSVPTDIPPDPLRHVAMPATVKKRTLTYITLGRQNAAQVKVGSFYAKDPIVGFVSRIVHEHLNRNWDKLYAPQVEMDNLDNWK